ncbi:hypothetical protein Sango_1928000 [Sesamum angolense]|uniref:Retrotransposon gag domain-containing protein n=1 Tax=Sesamum angolense TaxID=2727404 RepID=A0AAE2BN32_9LAMI|nr:hypothetical protein Sango_1928000 [Sesamum angolense]
MPPKSTKLWRRPSRPSRSASPTYMPPWNSAMTPWSLPFFIFNSISPPFRHPPSYLFCRPFHRPPSPTLPISLQQQSSNHLNSPSKLLTALIHLTGFFSPNLSLISFYMKDEALSWFKWMSSNHQLTSWDAFLWALELRFGFFSFDNPQAALFKLRQHGSVANYQVEFERLYNRVLGLPLKAMFNCFISGLCSDIQQELAVFLPSSISQAIGLAKLLESKFYLPRRFLIIAVGDSYFSFPNSASGTSPLLVFPLDSSPLLQYGNDGHRAFILIAMRSSASVTNAKPSNFSFFFPRNPIH